MKGVPVVFCHSGNQEYLRCAIQAAEKSGNKVVLLGDMTNERFCNNWINQHELNLDSYQQFEKVYKHLSTNSPSFELGCFKRYFLIKSYMESIGINACFMVDSDVLLFQDLNELDIRKEMHIVLSRRLEQPQYGWTASPHIFYCTIGALNEFIDFLFAEYSDNLSQLQEKYDYYQQNSKPGGVCDMTLLYLWSIDRSDCLNLCTIHDPVYDLSVQSINQFADKVFVKDTLLNMKKIVLVNNEYQFCLRNGTRTKAAAIHFQGTAKSLMCDYWNRKPYLMMLIHRYLNYASSIAGKILKTLR